MTRLQAWSVTRMRITEDPMIRGKRLGRHVHHDSRSLAYPWAGLPGARLGGPGSWATVLHARRIPILDQGQAGSCTGNGEVGCLGTDPLFDARKQGVTLDEAEALAVYSAAEVIDGDGPYPPQDNGSSGLSAAQTFPVSIGINWYGSFDSPPSSALLSISPGASVRGGHEVMLRGIDVDSQTVFGDNSWGPGWGLGGSFQMGWVTLDRLLHEDGDGTVSLPLSLPPPVPVPPPPPPPLVPSPDVPDRELWASGSAWAARRHAGGNAAAAAALRLWASRKGLA